MRSNPAICAAAPARRKTTSAPAIVLHGAAGPCRRWTLVSRGRRSRHSLRTQILDTFGSAWPPRSGGISMASPSAMRRGDFGRGSPVKRGFASGA